MAVTTIERPTIDAKTRSGTGRRIWRTGVAAGLCASLATAAFAAFTHAAGVSFTVGGTAIPTVGFAQVTFVAALIGTVIAAALSRWAPHPRRTFVVTTVALTLVSFVPDALAHAPASTRLALALSHVIAAAIVIPALAARISD